MGKGEVVDFTLGLYSSEYTDCSLFSVVYFSRLEGRCRITLPL